VSRWKGYISHNITVLAISKYISERLPVENLLIYDAYPFSEEIAKETTGKLDVLKIAVVGRITGTKGYDLMPRLIELIEENRSEEEFIFELYGEIASDVVQNGLLDELQKSKCIVFKGFEERKGLIYHSVDCILHLSKQEPLGRIFFEAIDYNKPLVGFMAAGIGEIAAQLQVGHWLADPVGADPAMQIFILLKEIKRNYRSHVQEAKQKRKRAIQLFSIPAYRGKIDQLLRT
jgi:glycosyltransferase involved in cell wall biosynthesis